MIIEVLIYKAVKINTEIEVEEHIKKRVLITKQTASSNFQ